MRLGKEIKLSGFLKQIFLDIEFFLSSASPQPVLLWLQPAFTLSWVKACYWINLLFIQLLSHNSCSGRWWDDFVYFVGNEPQQIKSKTNHWFLVWCHAYNLILVYCSFLYTFFLEIKNPLPVSIFVHCDGGCIVSRVLIVTVASTWSWKRNNLKRGVGI